MDKLKTSILSNPYTSLLAVAGIVALGIYSKQVTAAQAINFVLTILLGLSAADGKNSNGEPTK